MKTTSDKVYLLILEDEDPNINQFDNSPLMVSSVRGHVEICDALINAGADIHFLDKYENNALWLVDSCEHLKQSSYCWLGAIN